jgi:hypothetical protein
VRPIRVEALIRQQRLTPALGIDSAEDLIDQFLVAYEAVRNTSLAGAKRNRRQAVPHREHDLPGPSIGLVRVQSHDPGSIGRLRNRSGVNANERP